MGAASLPHAWLSVPFSPPHPGSSDVRFLNGLFSLLHNHAATSHGARLPKGPHGLLSSSVFKKEILLGSCHRDGTHS